MQHGAHILVLHPHEAGGKVRTPARLHGDQLLQQQLIQPGMHALIAEGGRIVEVIRAIDRRNQRGVQAGAGSQGQTAAQARADIHIQHPHFRGHEAAQLRLQADRHRGGAPAGRNPQHHLAGVDVPALRIPHD